MPESILERPAPPADRRIRYGDHPLHFADLRLPAGAGSHPCAIAIHGGFWRNLHGLDYLGHLCAALAARGIATWNIEYRRVGDPGGGWSGSFYDVMSASRYLFDHAEELNIDPGRVIAVGHSAGGHFASWLASLGNIPEDSEIAAAPLPLRGAVPLAGVMDLARCFDLHLSNDAVVGLLGGTPADVPERYAAASPVALTPSPAPHLLVHGTEDVNVPVELSERYQASAEAAGGRSTPMVLSGADHFDVVDPGSPFWPEIEDAIVRLAME